MHGTGYRLENELYSMHWAGVPESKLDSMLYSSSTMDVGLHSFMNGELLHFAPIHCISPPFSPNCIVCCSLTICARVRGYYLD